MLLGLHFHEEESKALLKVLVHALDRLAHDILHVHVLQLQVLL